jgi:O-antigen ligase
MIWSHTYLGGVEAIRWFIFRMILWMALNTLNRERVQVLVLGVHWGAVVACLWGLLQFWFDFSYFPQGPNPASTFVNRNFIAEFVACTVPFSAYLLLRSRSALAICVFAASFAFNLVLIMATGTRSALAAMLIVFAFLPVMAYVYRKQFEFSTWDSGKRILALGVFFATMVVLGLMHTGNPKILEEGRGSTAFERGFSRTASIVKTRVIDDGSFGVRLIMWKATVRMIKARPLSGVGAGAWEVDIPLYQDEGAQLETDYYVHNEILQLLGEYGLVGWICLLGLLGYLLLSTWRTLRNRSPEGMEEGPVRALALIGMLSFLVISNAGFPWRLASTAVVFAFCLALLAASDARLRVRGALGITRLPWRPGYSQAGAVAMMICLALTLYISQQAAECEQKIVRAVKLALTISQSGDYNNPKWDRSKQEMLKLIKEGTDINRHYRKITPMVADELAKWGDWKNAEWVWDTVVSSRPYVVAIMSNIARADTQLGNFDKALAYLERCKKIQPSAPSVRSLEVVLLSRTNREPQAAELVRGYFKQGAYDYDLVNAAYVLGSRLKDWDLAIQGLELRNKGWPAQAVDGWIKIGNIKALEKKDEAGALQAYKAALDATPSAQREATKRLIFPQYIAKLGQ